MYNEYMTHFTLLYNVLIITLLQSSSSIGCFTSYRHLSSTLTGLDGLHVSITLLSMYDNYLNLFTLLHYIMTSILLRLTALLRPS